MFELLTEVGVFKIICNFNHNLYLIIKIYKNYLKNYELSS